jgi:hypothetical protein
MEHRFLMSICQKALKAAMMSPRIISHVDWRKRPVKSSGPEALSGGSDRIIAKILLSVNRSPKSPRSAHGRSRRSRLSELTRLAGTPRMSLKKSKTTMVF